MKEKETLVLCPGSFDPITKGHIDIIARAGKMFDRVIVLVMCNHAKSAPCFAIEERMDLSLIHISEPTRH